MNDDSLKRKLYDDASPLKKINQSPVVKMARANYQKARTELEQNPKMRNDLKIASIGVLVGIIMGGLMATLTGSPTGHANFARATGAGSNSLVGDLKGPGWNPIHVFYGKMDHLYADIPEKWYLKNDKKHTAKNSKEWFGQHGQDVAVAKFFGFKENGYFVDLASNDAVWASNTFALEQNFGWKGICIEANPTYWYRLSFRTGCHVVGAVVGGKDFDEISVNLPNDPKQAGPFGGIVGKDFDNKKEKGAEKRYTPSLTSILQKFNAPKIIDYLSLDVEGAEEFIMKDFPFHHPYSFRLISIERPKGQLKKVLQQKGYKLVMEFDRGDTLWAHRMVHDAGKKLLNQKQREVKQHWVEGWPKTAKK